MRSSLVCAWVCGASAMVSTGAMGQPGPIRASDAFIPGETVVVKGQEFRVLRTGDTVELTPPLEATASLGAFITPVSAQASSQGKGRSVNNIINGSGLTEKLPGSGVFVHTANAYAAGGSMWNTDYGQRENWVRFDLGESMSLSGLYVWNYNEKGHWSQRSVKDMDVSVSDDGTNWKLVAAGIRLDKAPGTEEAPAQAVPFDQAVEARHVRFDIKSNHWNPGELFGLSEVRFANAKEAAPEPSFVVPDARYPRPEYPSAHRGAVPTDSLDVRFPDDFGHADVTQPPFNAKGDGVTDDTQAIQAALDANPSGLIYLPNGTYLISDVLLWPRRAEARMTTLQGQSRTGTVIKLKDSALGFSNRMKPRPMIWTGKAPAQRFGNEVRNLTLDTGTDNHGAVGAQFMSSNTGTIDQVDFVSGDGNGAIGLDLGYTDEQGPLLVRNVRVRGFNVGISTVGSVNSVTLEDIVLEDQGEAGFRNGGQPISARRLVSRNKVPAIVNLSGLFTLIESQLEGEGPAAIQNNGHMLVRDSHASGDGLAIDNRQGHAQPVPIGSIDEFLSHPALTVGDTPGKTLRLEIKDPPMVEVEDPAKWVNALSLRQPEDKGNDALSVQRAIDSGATTVYLPRGTYNWKTTVVVRGDVRHIIAAKTNIKAEGSHAMFHIADGNSPVVKIERVTEWTWRKDNDPPLYTIDTARTVILDSLNGACGTHRYTGGGEVFLNNVVMHHMDLSGSTKVWARQLNVEVHKDHIVNRGGTLWVLGLKTEGKGNIIDVRDNGAVEILGGLVYNNVGGGGQPILRTDGSPIAATLTEQHFIDKPYDVVIEVTGGSDTGKVLKTNPGWGTVRATSLVRGGSAQP